MKLKYGENAKLCYMNTNSFIGYVKTKDIYKDIAEDVERRFELDYLKEEIKKVLRSMKDESDWQIMKKFVELKQKHGAI